MHQPDVLSVYPGLLMPVNHKLLPSPDEIEDVHEELHQVEIQNKKNRGKIYA